MTSARQDETDPTGVADNTPRGNSEVARARNRKANAAVQMRTAGASWEEIADVLGFPSGNHALVATERALEKEMRTPETQEQLRQLAGARLERLLRSVWARAINPEDPDQLAAVNTAKGLVDRHAKLYGLDAPTQYVVHSPTQQELESWVTRVTSQAMPGLPEADIFGDVVAGSVSSESEDAVPSE